MNTISVTFKHLHNDGLKTIEIPWDRAQAAGDELCGLKRQREAALYQSDAERRRMGAVECANDDLFGLEERFDWEVWNVTGCTNEYVEAWKVEVED